MLQIFGVRIDSLSREELLSTLRSWLAGDHAKHIATPNAEMLLRARTFSAFTSVLNSADLLLPDTISVEYAAVAYGMPVQARHTGVDTLHDLAKICEETGKPLVLFGGDPGSATAAARALQDDHPNLNVHGIDPGRVEMHEEGRLNLDSHIETIREHGPAVLAVALGAGKQEYAVRELLAHVPSARIGIGVGGAFEMIGGSLPRAPQWMQKRGLEWLWRLRLEPSRLGRILQATIVFPSLVAFDTLRQKRFMSACRAVLGRLMQNTHLPDSKLSNSPSTMTVRTRIAPSPTGYVHIGTLRTALFNYFLARQSEGKYVIRIEDTDRERLVEGAVENLLEVMAQIGLSHDEGPFLEDGVLVEQGEFGPYTQSQRLETYREYIDKLIAQGDAYHCFCTKERLDEMRKQQQATKQTPKYDRTCCKLSEDDVKAKLESGESHVVRLKIPEGETVFEDLVRGTVKIQNKEIDDQVIMKSDGYPTYHMAVVVDDHLMNITHVLRGEEWISSTPKHVILHEKLGFDLPQYAHLPLLLNPDKSKLSKRQGDVAVEDYLKRGYLAEALVNFVGTLGYNPKGDQEIYSLDELIASFDITKVKPSGAVMNMEKLDWMNNHYIRQLSEEELASVAQSFVQANVDDPAVRRAMLVERERINRLDELNERLETYVMEPAYDPNMLVWKKADAADAKTQLEGVLEVINSFSDDDLSTIEAVEKGIRAHIEEKGLQNGNVLWPLRVALSGQQKSASPFELLWALGKEQGTARIQKAISIL